MNSAALARPVGGGTDRGSDQLFEWPEVALELGEYIDGTHPVTGVDAGVEIGDESNGDVALLKLTRQYRFGVSRSCSPTSILGGHTIGFLRGWKSVGLRRPPSRHHRLCRVAVLRYAVEGSKGRRIGPCTPPLSKNVCARPLVRSTSWSGTTHCAGPEVCGQAADGARRENLSDSEHSQRPHVRAGTERCAERIRGCVRVAAGRRLCVLRRPRP